MHIHKNITLKHLKLLQHISIFLDNVRNARCNDEDHWQGFVTGLTFVFWNKKLAGVSEQLTDSFLTV